MPDTKRQGDLLMDVLTARAYSAYFREAERIGAIADQPSGSSGPRTVDGHRYVVLENRYRLLAVYRVRNDGRLKRLRQWPTEFDK